MPGLDESAAFDDGELYGGIGCEGLRHGTQPTVGIRHPPGRRGRWGWNTDGMFGEHRYTVTSVWTGDRGTGTSGYRDYDRSVTLSIHGKPDLLASSDKPFRGDPARWNPEDMLLASLSECLLLSYLHACVTAGVRVVSYCDRASGRM